MSVKSLLTDEICSQVNEISKLEVGSEACKTAINGAGVLMDKLNDVQRLEIEQRKLDMEREKIDIELVKAENDRRDKKIKNGIAIGTAATGAMITVGMGLLAYVYEERGTISSKPGRSAIDRALNYFFKR